LDRPVEIMEKDLFQKLIDKMDAALIRSSDIELKDKERRPLPFSEILGNLDAGGCLILTITAAVILSATIFLGDYLTRHFSFSRHVYLVTGLVAVVAGFVIWHLLFRVKRWLKR
jgi:hypothetical protein